MDEHERLASERFATWQRQIAAQPLTPVLLVALGYGPLRGQTHLLLPDAPPFADWKMVASFLRAALVEVHERIEATANEPHQEVPP